MPTSPVVVLIVATDPQHPEVDRIQRAIQDAMEQLRERDAMRSELAATIARMPPKQLDVLRRSLAGETTKRIARRHKVSTRTIERYRAAAFRALGVKTIAETASLCAQAGLTIPPEETW